MSDLAASPGTLASPLFFASPEEFREWLRANHKTATELWVGYHRIASGRPSLTWEESVDVALCFGWIDGLRRRVDGSRYTIRFTPRRPGSNWSARNNGRMRTLLAAGLVEPDGLAAFRARPKNPPPTLSEDLAEEVRRRIRRDPAIERAFQSLAPWIRRQSVAWVASAKREETRERRLQVLLDSCAAGEPIPPLRRPAKGASRRA